MLPASRLADATSPGIEHYAGASRAKRGARARRWAGRVLLVVPGLLVVACDLCLRGAPLPWARLAYTRAAILEVVLWASLFGAAAARRGVVRWGARALVLGLGLLAVGGQLYVFGRYRAFLNTSAMLFGTTMLPSIRHELWFDRASFLTAVLPPIALLVSLLVAHVRIAPSRRATGRRAGDLALALLLGVALYAPADDQDVGPFDALYIHGMGQLALAVWDDNPVLARVHPGPRTPRPVPALAPKPARARNVLFILTESVRAESACVAYAKDCRTTPFSNAAAKDRIPFTQMRSVDSTTAISLGVMWSGVAPSLSREELHAAPLVWEYASAAHIDTAYWTSQNLLFGNSGTWLEGVRWNHHVSATGLEPDASLETGADDGNLVSYVTGRLAALHEPFMAVVHLSNTHMPYAIDERDAPFQPQTAATGAGNEVGLGNRYADAIYHQDRAVGRLILAERALPRGARTVIVFLSDHGEQLYEKGTYGHTGTLFEQELRIPAWIDAPPGTLSGAEEAHLLALEDAPITTMDVLPTLLDLAGVMDDPAIQPLARTFVGKSLLRGGSPASERVALTNCTALWSCAFKNWGALSGTKKLIATQADHAWSCFDVKEDPFELADLGAPACGSLVTFAEETFHGRPF